MDRHGAAQHLLRPDGVYITSVLQPTVGYDPVADAQAVGAEFTTYGGLAGPVATMHRQSLGGPVDDLRSWWSRFTARIQSNLMANRILNDLRLHPAVAAAAAAAVAPVAPGSVMTLDTSPRPNPDAIAVQQGAPTPTSPQTVAAYVGATGDPGNQNITNTAATMGLGRSRRWFRRG